MNNSLNIMEEEKLYTIIIYTENKPGVLYRIADSFLKRKINIESLTVSEIETQALSRFTITVKGTRLAIEKITKQLYKIIEVVKVLEKTDEELIFREIALIKVVTKDAQKRRDIEDIARLAKAEVVSID